MTTLLPRRAPRDTGSRSWTWDLLRWRPVAVLRRGARWIGARRWRRWTAWVVAILFAFIVFPGVLGAVALADSSSGGSSVNSGLSWMDIHDSSGVNVSGYIFATNNGSVLHPLVGGKALVLNLEFAGWLVIVTTGVWLIGYVLGFRWMDLFAAPLHGVARSLTGQLATPIVLTTAVTIGAFFVGWFVLRGYHAKAAVQVSTMLAVVLLGSVFLADPLSEVVSSNGWLAQGRDLGIEIAAGLNGDSNPQPTQLVASMQSQLADNFARKPLQVWNFGHVVDDNPACKAAWSAAVEAGNDDGVRSAINGCGDSAAYAVANSPSAGQLGAGLLLLVAGTLLLAFGAVLAIRIVRSAMDSIYYGLAAIFGFSAGGYIVGPTQNFLIRCLVHAFFSAARMAAEITFLGVYVLFLGDLFEQAGGQVMAVFVIGAIVEVVAIGQAKRLSKSLESGNEWIANRIAVAVQSGGARTASGAGGGSTALGMGQLGAQRHGLGMLGTIGAISAINAFPGTAWLMGKTRTPMNPYARKERRSLLAQWGVWGQKGFGGPKGWYSQTYFDRKLFGAEARHAALSYGGIDTYLGAGAAIQAMSDVGAGRNTWYAGLIEAGFKDERVMSDAIDSWGVVADNAADYTLEDQRLGFLLGAVNRAQSTVARLTVPGLTGGDPDKAAADLATLESAAFRYHRANDRDVTLDRGVENGEQRRYLNEYMKMDSTSESRERMQAMLQIMRGTDPDLIETGPGGVYRPKSGLDTQQQKVALHAAHLRNVGVGEHEANRMYSWVGNEHARLLYESTKDLVQNAQDPARLDTVRAHAYRTQQTEAWASGKTPSPWKRMSPPSGTPKPAGYAQDMAGVARRLRDRS